MGMYQKLDCQALNVLIDLSAYIAARHSEQDYGDQGLESFAGKRSDVVSASFEFR